MAGEATGDEEQLVRQVGDHADSLATGGGVDEQLGCAVLHVAAEDVAGEQIAGVKVVPRPAAMPSAEVAPGTR